jgi:hypothetical protein
MRHQLLTFELALCFFASGKVFSQSNTLPDVMPLSVGNQWTYRYFTEEVIWPAGNPYEDRADSGTVSYIITGRTSDEDSTSWRFEVHRDLLRHQILWTVPRDTTFAIRDTSQFDFIENHQGQHQLYRNADPYLIRFDVFPFTRDYVDTTLIYRYREVGPGDTTTFLSWIAPSHGPTFLSTFTFKKGVGLVRNSYNSGSIDVFSFNEHVLINSIITSVARPVGSSTPSSFLLFQNYPNPFNPTTVVHYNLPAQSHVILKVFDVLGREVVSLVDAIEQAGDQSITLDASHFPSGIYFYRLQAGHFSETKKFVLLR